MASCSLINSDREIELASWVEHTVTNEIQRGVKLREAKVLSRGKDGDRFRVLKKPSLASSVYPTTRSRKQSPSPRLGMNSVRKRAKSNSPTHLSRSSPSSGRREPVCSMRISQLAVPTKRQCIETWRNKAYVLPEFMVHRLKQQVMDQTPIVQISDAVTCFKYKKPDNMTSKKRPRRKINKEAMKRRESEENKSLSVLFANKLLARLTKPAKITLIPRLENLAAVVATDICYMMRDRRLKHIRVNDDIHELVVREVSEKVTIWIAQILEDTKEKILEEDLRVKKMNERIPVTVNGEVMTLMNALLSKETELEEEEGPALDVLDDLVDNVLDICIPPVAEESDDRDNKSTDYLFIELEEKEVPALDILYDVVDNVLYIFIPSVAEESEDRDNKAESLDDRDNKSSDYLSMTSENNSDDNIDNDIKKVDDGDSIKKNMMNQLELIIINTIKSDEHLDFDDVAGHPNLDVKNSASDATHVYSKDVNDRNEKQSLKSESFQSVTSHSQHLDNDREVTLSTADDIRKHDEEKSSKVSDTLQISLSEEEKSKKVKFSNDDIGVLKGSSRHSNNSNPELYYDTDEAAGKNLSELSLGSLSIINDTWPKDLSPNIFKPSASAIMSITSLGRILELEENNILSIEAEVPTEQFMTQAEVSAEPVDTWMILDSPDEIVDPTYIGNKAKQYVNEQTVAHEINEKEENVPIQNFIENKVSNGPKEELDIEQNFNDDKIAAEHRKSVTEPDSNYDITRDESKRDDSKSVDTWMIIDSPDKIEDPTYMGDKAKQEFIERRAAHIISEKEENVPIQDLIHNKVSNEQIELDIEHNFNDYKISAEHREPVTESDSNDDITRDETKRDDSNKIETINVIDANVDDINEEYKDTREIDIYQDLWERIDCKLNNKFLSTDVCEAFDSKMTKKDTVSLENTVINKVGNGINHVSSKHSLISEIFFETQTYETKVLDMRAIEKYISKIRCECGESNHDIHEKQSEIQIGQMYDQNSKSLDTAAAKANTIDYRVRPETAPSWLSYGKGEPVRGGKDLSYFIITALPCVNIFFYRSKKPTKERERDIMKWCDDLDNILNNLSKWKTWLDYITKYITALKQKAELKTLGGRKIVTVDQLKPSNTSDKDVLKPNSNKRTKCGLKLYKNDETIQFRILPTTMATKYESCICSTRKTKRLRASRSPTKK